MNLQNICDRIVTGIKPTSRFILDAFGTININHAEEKSKNSLVSKIDIGAEKMLVTMLSSIIPEAGFVTEEGTVSRGNKELYWVIDPLDGTTNFLFGIPMVSIAIALKQSGKTIIGVIHHVNSGDTYHCTLGGGSFKNGIPIQVSSRNTMSEALIATGFPYRPEGFLDAQLKLIEHFILNTRGVRRLGSAAIDLAYVAEGIFDLYFESGLNEWDTCAGMLLVREAGGIASNMEGDQAYEAGVHIIASSPAIYQESLDLIQKMKEA